MTDQAMTHDEHEAHVHPPYMRVFAMLATLTLIELFIPPLIGDTLWLSATLLILIAIWKMKLITGYFMHLAFDARILLVIAAVPVMLASILVSVCLMEWT
ncbi:MAG: hypothetical protein CMJ18_21350 [Phycisphaeraceae bacterium]|jgi:caa(3)-type oxidase subunit IV|nr:hypothetical protein [Phycisphaeraceae bacterium]